MQTEQEPKRVLVQPGRNTAAYVGIAAGVVTFLSVLLYFMYFSNSINDYLEKSIEREFTTQYPAYALRISGFNYNIWKNRIGVDSLVLQSADTGFSCKIGKSWVNGIAWWRLMGKGRHKVKALSGARADAQGLVVKFPHSDYGFSCQRLNVSMPGGAITADDVELQPVVDDEQYFAGSKYRTTRFRLNIPECRVTGLAVKELLAGEGYLVRSIQLREPSFDALVDNYVPVDPGNSPSRMPNEMLNSIRQKIRIESLNLTNGKLKYGETYIRGATTATVTFDDLQLQAEGIANHGQPEDTTVVRGQAIFMQGGIMKLDLAIPLSSPEFSLKYSGSLDAMEINRLNPFLEHSEYLRIDSGVIARTITYDVQVNSGRSTGAVNAQYQGLKISYLNKKTGSSHGMIDRLASLLANRLKIRGENLPGHQATLNIGKVEYQRNPQDTFIQFLWFSLRSGVLDVIFM